MTLPVTIACVWVGEKYMPAYPAVLMDMVGRNIPPTYAPRFVCITDRPGELPAGMEAIEPEPGLPGWWQKIALFKPGKLPGGRIAYFDLDVAITGELGELIERPGIVKDWHLAEFNSSVMVWDAGDHADVWDRFAPVLMTLRHDQEWITVVGGWTTFPPEWCVSYRSHAAVWPPAGCKVVVFHGDPKPHEIAEGWVPTLWRVGGLTALPKMQGINVTREALLDNIRAACKRDLDWFVGAPDNGRECCIVGGGPSLAAFVDEIRDRQADGAAVVSLNGSLRWLLNRGIVPSSHVVLDGRPENVQFVQNVPPETKVFVASQCHPDVFDALADHPKVCVWHAGTHYEELPEILRPYSSDDEPTLIVGGGSTVGLRAMFLAHLSGFRRLRLYGFDSCYAGDRHHAYWQSFNDGEGRIRVMMAGHEYECAVWMARQANEFNGQHDVLTREGCKIEAHGGGLLPDICRIRNQNATQAQTTDDIVLLGDTWWPRGEVHGPDCITPEVGKVATILPLCRKLEVAVQAGANVGLVPIELAKHFERVIAFEPHIANVKAARRNMNGARFDLIHAALGEKPGVAGLCGAEGNCGAWQTQPGAGSIRVMTLDSLALPACDLIMLDVEGDELLALRGAASTIAAHRPVVLVEEKGLGARHGLGNASDWLIANFGYRKVAKLVRDVVLAPTE